MLRALVVASLAVAALAPGAATAQSPPLPGAPGIGDTLFPSLGNGGYDVEQYALDLTYPAAQAEGVFGQVTITARAAQSLSRLNLDFDGHAVASVTVDDKPAAWTRQEEELVVTPARPIRDRRRFDVRVAFVGRPTHIGSDGSVLAAQPDRAHEVLPSNDHPRDKATWRIRLTVPEGTTAVANGAFVRSRTTHGRTTWEYRHRHPMAPELLQLAVGAFDVTDAGRADGVRLRHVTPRDATAQLLPALAGTADHLRFMRERVGRYPFERYGILVSDAVFTLALETQTLSLFPRSWFSPFDARFVEPIMVHELAHQWFGNSVSPDVWRDVWLNEGHATFYEYEYAAARGWIDLDGLMRGIYRRGDGMRAAFGPVARPPAPGADGFRDVFNPNVYDGGALALYALRQEVGEEVFRRIERSFVRRYRHGVAGTEDFIATASREAGRDLAPFLRIWLYGTATPPMPGHPDWTVEGSPPAG